MKTWLLAMVVCWRAFAPTATFGQASAPSLKISNMKQFSLLVRVPQTYSTEQAKAVGPQWERLIEQWKSSGIYVLSFAFPGRSFTVSGTDKVLTEQSVLSDGLRMVSNLVIQAASIERAAELAKACPILAYGGSVEIREIPNPLAVDHKP